MRALRVALIAALAAFALAAAACGSDDDEAADDTTTLTETTDTDTTTDTGAGGAINGTVGPGFDISVDQTSVTAGSYELEVEDLSDIHNFHLTGPGGIDVTTDVAGEGTESFTVELEAGTYTFVCDPHAGQMTGTIEVG
ncbi:MAG: plastocyanin/azurin family copper-binding protein [Actinomycetota bacterium]|nr:plastocyanin/azurin family copper-binding protein [Actinomycetota bacterium]